MGGGGGGRHPHTPASAHPHNPRTTDTSALATRAFMSTVVGRWEVASFGFLVVVVRRFMAAAASLACQLR